MAFHRRFRSRRRFSSGRRFGGRRRRFGGRGIRLRGIRIGHRM